MSDAQTPQTFDPYYTWFGIPPTERPISYYRLLGLSPLESNEAAIEAAADQRLAYLRTKTLGAHAMFAERLISEVIQARLVLLDPVKKQAYDAALSRSLQERPVISQEQTPDSQLRQPQVAVTLGMESYTPGDTHRFRKKSRFSKEQWIKALALSISFCFVLVAVGLWFSYKKIGRQQDPNSSPKQEELAGGPAAPRANEGSSKEVPEQIQEEAAATARRAQNEARRLLAEKRYAEARAVLQPLVERFGIAEHAEAARQLLVEIDQAEKTAQEGAAPVPAVSPEPVPVEPSKTSEELAAEAALKRLQELEARYGEATRSAEALAAVWDFRGAAAELAKLKFDEAELASRVRQRVEELQRMQGLKEKLITAINRAKPPLQKSQLGLKGLGGEVIGADEEGLTTRLLNGKTERLEWSSLGASGVERLFSPKQFEALVGRDGEAWLAAGLVALTLGNAAEAERCMFRAKELGVAIEPYLSSLAGAAFGRITEGLKAAQGALAAARQSSEPASAKERFANVERQFRQMASQLDELETRYRSAPWYSAHQQAVAGARQAVQRGLEEAAAEQLYAEAAELLAQKEYFDLKPIVEQLKSEYADTAPVTDASRKPTFAELEQAVANLGRRIVVRQDGKGDFTSIQAAIDAAPPNSVIEIQDNGPYSEKLVIARRLEIRGSRKSWPILLSQGRSTPEGSMVDIRAEGVMVRRIAIVTYDPSEHTPACVYFRTPASIKSLILSGANVPALRGEGSVTGQIIDSLILSSFRAWWKASLRNCLVLNGMDLLRRCEVEGCVVQGVIHLGGRKGHLIRDTIVLEVTIDAGVPYQIENCAFVKPGIPGGAKNSFVANPRFRDPAILDYRLIPDSPCIGKASDGGDIGCRYTPEMIEMCKVALELRARGIIKF